MVGDIQACHTGLMSALLIGGFPAQRHSCEAMSLWRRREVRSWHAHILDRGNR